MREHFEGSPDTGFYLTAEGRRIVFIAFDEMMERCVETGSGKISLRQIVDAEVCKFIRMIEGEEAMTFYRAA